MRETKGPVKTKEGTARYEMVIGLEVHVELKTAAKIFCGCPTGFGAAPNTQCCPVCMGLPGTLPVLNGQVVRHAVTAGLATHCTIARFSKQDRKNYFYPDLPKAYQISQYDLPLCANGWLDIEAGDGPKRVGITRIHIEEDAGKLVHLPGGKTLIDYNRCGVPLIEIVSAPDIRSAGEAVAYLKKLRAILLYAGVSDCKMQEGSLRCDVNLSVRPAGEKALGTRTEIKNLNSFLFIEKAIAAEYARQAAALGAGEEIVQETRRFDPKSGSTAPMRKKEDANDYRYFPDPDLAPIRVGEELLSGLAEAIPELPDARKARYMGGWGLNAGEAETLVGARAAADYFEAAAAHTAYPKILCSLLLTEALRLLPAEDAYIPIAPAHLAQVAQLVGEGAINSGTAKGLVQQLWHNDTDPRALVEQQGLRQVRDAGVLAACAARVLGENPKPVADYRAGKRAALQALVGKMMAATQGRGHPAAVREALLKALGAGPGS